MKLPANLLPRGLMAAGVAAAAVYLVGLAVPCPTLRVTVKAIPVLCLAGGVALRSTGAPARLVVGGLLLSAVGDLLLELGRFLPGLAAFLAAHIAYVLAFLSEARQLAIGRALPSALYGTAVYLFLHPQLGPQSVPVLAYTLAICTMLWRAAARVGGPGDRRAAWIGLAGALLFAASDTLIALDRFHGRLPGARYPIILLYWLGQLGIAASVLPQPPRRRFDILGTPGGRVTSIPAHPALEALASVYAIREHFPALERLHEGRPVAYFDGPGGTQVPREVVQAVSDYLLHHNANTHWRYPTSEETDAALQSAREALADFLGATAGEIVFGANMTTLTFHLGRALGRRLSRGDEIVVTELDHHANSDTWRALEQDRGVVVRTARFDPDSGELDVRDFERCLLGRPKLVAFGAAANALGTVNDVPRLAALARDAGALVFVDAVHYAPHALVDVHALGADFLACSAYKFYGPHVGVLYGRHDRLLDLEVPKVAPASDDPPEHLETGTISHEGVVGARAAVDFLASLSDAGDRRPALRRTFEALHERGQRLVRRMWEGLSEIRGVTLYGPPPSRPRTPTVAFTVAGRPSGEVAAALARRALFLSHGDFYAATVVRRLGQAAHGVVRAGAACYTTDEEVERLIEGVAEVARSR